jgi:hypothetical protein
LPPNWITDPISVVIDYGGAIRLTLDESIPVAWVPDQDTIKLLPAVCGSGAARGAQLHNILLNPVRGNPALQS